MCCYMADPPSPTTLSMLSLDTLEDGHITPYSFVSSAYDGENSESRTPVMTPLALFSKSMRDLQDGHSVAGFNKPKPKGTVFPILESAETSSEAGENVSSVDSRSGDSPTSVQKQGIVISNHGALDENGMPGLHPDASSSSGWMFAKTSPLIQRAQPVSSEDADECKPEDKADSSHDTWPFAHNPPATDPWPFAKKPPRMHTDGPVSPPAPGVASKLSSSQEAWPFANKPPKPFGRSPLVHGRPLAPSSLSRVATTSSLPPPPLHIKPMPTYPPSNSKFTPMSPPSHNTVALSPSSRSKFEPISPSSLGTFVLTSPPSESKLALSPPSQSKFEPISPSSLGTFVLTSPPSQSKFAPTFPDLPLSPGKLVLTSPPHKRQFSSSSRRTAAANSHTVGNPLLSQPIAEENQVAINLLSPTPPLVLGQPTEKLQPSSLTIAKSGARESSPNPADVSLELDHSLVSPTKQTSQQSTLLLSPSRTKKAPLTSPMRRKKNTLKSPFLSPQCSRKSFFPQLHDKKSSMSLPLYYKKNLITSPPHSKKAFTLTPHSKNSFTSPLYSRKNPLTSPLHSRRNPLTSPLHSRRSPFTSPPQKSPFTSPLHSRKSPFTSPLHSRMSPFTSPLHNRKTPVNDERLPTPSMEPGRFDVASIYSVRSLGSMVARELQATQSQPAEVITRK